jgi:Ran GTPase-activating protein (RanGAP) involved in mRNA processing and transport
MKNQNLTYLDLAKNPLGDQGVTILMHAIKRSNSIYHLNLSSTGLTHKGAKRIFRALHKNESLVSLSLGCIDGVLKNRIGVKGVK